MPEIAAAESEVSTGLPGGFRLEVTGPDSGRPTLHAIDAPFALIGRAKGCGLRLNHPAVSHRHTYLQAVLGRVYCVNLTSHGQTLWPDGPRKADWIELNETVGIGPYKVRLVETLHPGQEHDRTPAGFSPLDPYAGQCGPMPKVEITFLTGAGDRSKSTVTRLITLAGSSARCKFRFEDPSVSSVHFSFVLTPDGLWVVDLAGRDGVTVNRQPVRSAKLRDKDKLLAGTFLMRIEENGESLAAPRAIRPSQTLDAELKTPTPTPLMSSEPAVAKDRDLSTSALRKCDNSDGS